MLEPTATKKPLAPHFITALHIPPHRCPWAFTHTQFLNAKKEESTKSNLRMTSRFIKEKLFEILPWATQNSSWIINYILTRSYKRKAQSCIDIYIFFLKFIRKMSFCLKQLLVAYRFSFHIQMFIKKICEWWCFMVIRLNKLPKI